MDEKSSQRPEGEAKRVMDAEGRFEEYDSRIEDYQGSPTWPIPSAVPSNEAPIPPVGLNWGGVANRLGVDRRVLEHDGSIILRGEYFPESGFFLDPETLLARHVDVGDIALRHGYFLGDLTTSEFQIQIPLGGAPSALGKPVIVPEEGAVIGLFSDQTQADRAVRKILKGSLGTGLKTERGPLGVELRVGRPQSAGGVASIVAGQGGAVISVAGRPVIGGQGAMSTASSLSGGAGDARRPGTGVTGGSEGPVVSTGATEVSGGQEFSPS